MPMSPEEIAKAVDYFARKNTARLGSVQAAAQRPQNGGGSFGGGSAGSTPKKPIIGPPAKPKKNWWEDPEGVIRNVTKGIPVLGSWLSMEFEHDNGSAEDGTASSVVDDVFVPMEEDQAPKNATQWIINALTTGNYAGAEFTNEIGNQINTNQWSQKLGEGDVGGALGELGETIAAPVGAAGKGALEGLGQRFDGKRPVTWGQNFDAVGGVNDQVRGLVKNLGGDEGAQNFWSGVTGFTADVALDPLSYVTGTGFIKGAQAGANAVGDGIRAGDDIISALGKGTESGFAARADYLQGLKDAKVARVDARAARKNEPVALVDQLEAERTVQPDVQFARPDAAPAAPEILGDLVDDTVLTPKTVQPDVPPTVAAGDPRMPAIEELLPNLRSTGREVDAGGILQAAKGAPVVDDTLASSVTAALRSSKTVPELKSALKVLKSTPNGARFLRSTITVGGKKMTVGQALESAATRRMSGGNYTAHAVAVENALQIGAKLTMPTTADGLTAAVAGAGFDTGFDAAALMEKLTAAATPEARMDVLRDALGASESAGFATFDDAMKAAVDNQVEASMMRSMLKALGIETRATKPATLQQMLATRGQMNWDEIKQAQPTAQEVLDDHGVTGAVNEAAKTADTPGLAETARGDYEAIVEDAVGFDPLVIDPTSTPTAAGLIGQMIRDGVHAIDELTPTTAANYVEKFDNEAWLAVHRAMFKRGSAVMNNPRGAAAGLAGAARADFFYGRWLTSMKAVTAHAVSRGQIPRLQYGANQQPLYLSIDQIASALPDETVKQALFNLNYRLSKPGAGKAAADDFKLGLTVYPTTIGNGTRVAVNGGDAEKIFAAMNRRPNAFEKTPEGQQALRDLAEQMANPAFRTEMTSLHQAQEIAAVAIAQKAADDIIAPLAQRIILAISRNGERSEVLGAIDNAIAAAHKVAPAGENSLLRDMVTQRANNGILAALGEIGTAIARSDVRANKAAGAKTPAQQLDAQQASNASRPKGKDGRFVPPEIPKGSTAAEKTLRGETAQNLGATSRDLEGAVDELAARQIEEGAYEATDLGYIQAVSEIEQALGPWRLFAKVGRGMEGTWGMPNLKNLQVMVQSGSFVYSHKYVQSMTAWIHGGKMGGVLGAGAKKVEGLDARLGEDLGLGRKATDEEVNGVLSNLWQSLSVHAASYEGRFKKPITPESLRFALAEGAMRDVRINVPDAVPALSAAQVDIAMELKQYIDEVFAPVDGPLARSGVTTSDLMREMERFGFSKGGEFEAMMLHGTEALGDRASIWQTYDTALMANPLDVLANWHKALSASSVMPSVGASMSRLFDHRSANLTPAQAHAAGWQRLDTKVENARLAAYLDPESYFPPEIIKEAAYLQRFFADMEKNLPALVQQVVRPYDAITGVLKSSMTIWNVSHHITNILGEFAMLVMAGVNPLHAIRSLEAIKAGGKLADADFGAIDIYRSTFADKATPAAPSQGQLKDRWFGGDARVALKGPNGTSTTVNVTPAQIWQRALSDGTALTARESKDLLPGIAGAGSITGSSRWNKFAQHKGNIVAQADQGLGEFSAVRDNVTRLAHYYSALESGTFSTVEEAFKHAAAQVHSYHPTIQTLSSFDQKVSRRIVFFHTWVRQAAGRVIQTALERPAMVTIPSEWQYNQAEANGLEPESFGRPFGADSRIASYYYDGLLGPTYEGGYAPLSSPDDLPDDEDPHQWGYSLSSPQIDALQTFFGGVQFDEGPQGSLWQMAGLLNPLLKMPIELTTDSTIGGIGQPVSNDYPGYFFGQTGAPDRIAGALGMQPKAGFTDEENAGDAIRKGLNYLTGFKHTDYTNSTSASVAENERREWEVKQLENLGYSPEQIKKIRGYWKDLEQ